MDRMTILQLDSVNVLARSHYLPFFARLGRYNIDKLDKHLRHSGKYFEYLSHEASIVSQDVHPYLRWRMDETRWKRFEELNAKQQGYYETVFDEVKACGPLSVKELSDAGSRTGPWWGMPKGKLALEGLYTSGRLAIRERTGNFVTVYDVPERVIRPEILDIEAVEREEAYRHLLLLGARSHGIGTAGDLGDYFRLPVRSARSHLADLAKNGQLEQVEVDGWGEPAYLHPEARRPRKITGRALLSPFDPAVWFRPRAERLFGFTYRIEIYVPQPKRVYGYYVLPFLLDGELVGRVDLKADRSNNRLWVRGAFVEPGASPHRVATEMLGALNEMAEWLKLSRVDIEQHGNLGPALAKAKPAPSD